MKETEQEVKLRSLYTHVILDSGEKFLFPPSLPIENVEINQEIQRKNIETIKTTIRFYKSSIKQING